jgi:hypothetical protein
MLTGKQKVVRSYWPYMLGLCEGLFLDLANLNPKPTDPKQCERFRAKWSGKFREWLESEDDVLFGLRNIVHDALRQGDLETLALRLANLPALPGRSHAHLDLPYLESGDPTSLIPRLAPEGFRVALLRLMTLRVNRLELPILFDMPRALAAAILNFTGQGLRLVRCDYCERCAIGRSNQRFCPGGKCRRAWHESQPATKDKRRKYMRDYMSDYRAQEKERNRINLRLAGRKHAKAT